MHDDFSSKPLALENWPDFEKVMGKQGGCYGCWCTYFRMPPKERQETTADERKAFMLHRVQNGPPPGIIAYLGGMPVGWVQVTPRQDVPRWNTPRTVSRPLEEVDAADPACWAISCFFLQSKYRGQGLSHKLLAAAVEHARTRGAAKLEACPIARTKQSKSVGLFVGPERIFREFGFQEVASRKAGRPLMRYRFD